MTTRSVALLIAVAWLGVAPAPSVPLRPCPADKEQTSGALCGQVSVPENRAKTGGRQIALSVVVLPGRSPSAKTDPVFGFAGGPGAAATRLSIAYPRLYDMLQNDHDIVLVDQRGTGDSNPLFCSTADLTKTPAAALAEPMDDAAVTACRDRLAKIADLAQYTTAAAVEDVEAVRAALGYGRINLLGNSYGTRVALEYLRRYPAQVRAIALNGVFAPGHRTGLNGPREAQQSLDDVIARCAAASACNDAFPKLAAEVASVFAAVEKAPATAAVPIGDGQPLKVTLTRATFARELRQLLMSREGIQALPILFHAAAGGDFMPFAAAALESAIARSGQADGMALSVLCASDAGSAYPAAPLAQATRGTFLRDERAQFLKRACAIWPHAAPLANATAPVLADTPAVLISGALDPSTPPVYATAVAKGLPNSVHAVFASAAHVPANPCVHGVLAAFFKSGSTAGLDTACVAAFPALRFMTSMPRERQ